MISNTVIIFLRDLLPLFVLFSFLSAMSFSQVKRSVSRRLLVFIGLTITFVIYFFIEQIAQTFDGNGLEILDASLAIGVWLFLVMGSLLLHYYPQLKVDSLIYLGVIAMFVLKGGEFFVYFSIWYYQELNVYPILLGCIMGFGICASFYALFSFALAEILRTGHQRVFWFMWFGFLAGQISQITNFLSQVDIISLGQPLLNLNKVVDDGSEYGHVLNALFGYESSPTSTFIIIYLCALFIPIVIRLGLKHYAAPHKLEASCN